MRRLAQRDEREADDFDGATGSVLVVGFGRFGQIVSQYLLAENVDVVIIDTDAGDDPGGRPVRLQGLLRRRHAARRAARRRPRAGAADRDLHRRRRPTNRIVDLVQSNFPAPRSSRVPTTAAMRCELLAKDVDFELRETFESAMRFGRETLVAIGVDADRAAIVEDFIRTRDRDRLAVQQAEGIYAGADLLRTRPTPTPLSTVQRDARALNMEAGELIAGENEEVEG